ncbi:hypothetical protein [Kalamiella sp. sgz302252]
MIMILNSVDTEQFFGGESSPAGKRQGKKRKNQMARIGQSAPFIAFSGTF